jgi:DNA-binding MarR family transcriptional regulator
MGRRVPPSTADTRWYLSKFLREVDRAKLPGYSAALLLYISSEPGGRVSYAGAASECALNRGQMDRAVTALIKKRLIVSSDDDEDSRVKWLTITTDGQRVVDKLTGSG